MLFLLSPRVLGGIPGCYFQLMSVRHTRVLSPINVRKVYPGGFLLFNVRKGVPWWVSVFNIRKVYPGGISVFTVRKVYPGGIYLSPCPEECTRVYISLSSCPEECTRVYISLPVPKSVPEC